jgi:hypothetical protein
VAAVGQAKEVVAVQMAVLQVVLVQAEKSLHLALLTGNVQIGNLLQKPLRAEKPLPKLEFAMMGAVMRKPNLKKPVVPNVQLQMPLALPNQEPVVSLAMMVIKKMKTAFAN